MPDVFSVLKAGHDRILTLSGQLTGPSRIPPDRPRERKAIANQLVMELSRHEAVEEMVFWPAVRERVDGGAAICEVALDQESTGKRLLNELLHVSAGNEEFDTLTQAVAASLREHISYEQNIVWPKLRLRVTDEEARTLGAEMERAGRLAPTRPHPHVPPNPALLRKLSPAAAILDRARNALIRRPALSVRRPAVVDLGVAGPVRPAAPGNHTPPGIPGAWRRFHRAWMPRPCTPGDVAGTSTSYPPACCL
jgi:iron-sulfur cluster repair protein YtfE (RIC family)